jgi:large subunit ribosomal protein L15
MGFELGKTKPAEGSTTADYRRGRGHGSGNGKTAGRGHKGQKARSGFGGRAGFEGGQMPLYRRIPKKGFNSRNPKRIVAINVALLNVFDDDTEVTVGALQAKGLVSNPRDGVKILGEGVLKKRLTVRVNKFSESAVKKIETAGGRAEVV